MFGQLKLDNQGFSVLQTDQNSYYYNIYNQIQSILVTLLGLFVALGNCFHTFVDHQLSFSSFVT